MTNIVCDKLGIRYPILQGPMAWASDSKLAASVSNAGGLGIMGLGFCPPAVFEAEIRAARALTEAPFGLNIITCLPDADKLLEITLRQGIRVVEIETFPAYFDTLPRYVEALRSHGAATIGKASSVSEAKVFEAAGVDFVSVKGYDGGGHIFGLTGTFSLIPQVVDAVSIPVINSSGVADGRGVAASFMLGAAGVEVGFDVLKKTPSGSSDTRLPTLSYYNDYWHSNIGCFDSIEGQLISLRATYGGAAALNAGSACGVSWAAGTTIDQAIAKMQAGYNAYRGGANAAFFNYLDVLQGFAGADFGYRNKALAANAYSTNFVAGVRNDLLLRDTSQSWVEYTLPSTLVTGATYRFEVDIRKGYATSGNRLSALTFEIANRSLTAGGGYVSPDGAALADILSQGN